MDRTQHYNEAVRLLVAARITQDNLDDADLAGMSDVAIANRWQLIATTIATAQVHATLCAAPLGARLPIRVDDRSHLVEVAGVR
jgi:hypothetical protein